MSEHVLDASALLAVMLGESGTEPVLEILPGAVIGAVNLAEVVAKLQERGVPDAEIGRNIAELDLPVIPFDAGQAMSAGNLRARPTLGPVAWRPPCLALAMARKLPAVTTDRGWMALDVGVSVIVARG